LEAPEDGSNPDKSFVNFTEAYEKEGVLNTIGNGHAGTYYNINTFMQTDDSLIIEDGQGSGFLKSVVDVVSVEVDKAREALNAFIAPLAKSDGIPLNETSYTPSSYSCYSHAMCPSSASNQSASTHWFQHVFCNGHDKPNNTVRLAVPAKQKPRLLLSLNQLRQNVSITKSQILFIRRITRSRRCLVPDSNNQKNQNGRVVDPLRDDSLQTLNPNQDQLNANDKTLTKIVAKGLFVITLWQIVFHAIIYNL
jgi:hypothetical protein